MAGGPRSPDRSAVRIPEVTLLRCERGVEVKIGWHRCRLAGVPCRWAAEDLLRLRRTAAVRDRQHRAGWPAVAGHDHGDSSTAEMCRRPTWQLTVGVMPLIGSPMAERQPAGLLDTPVSEARRPRSRSSRHCPSLRCGRQPVRRCFDHLSELQVLVAYVASPMYHESEDDRDHEHDRQDDAFIASLWSGSAVASVHRQWRRGFLVTVLALSDVQRVSTAASAAPVVRLVFLIVAVAEVPEVNASFASTADRRA